MMPVLDLENLLEPVSAEMPCGENLEYDDDFGAMERAAQGKPDQQFGKTEIAGEGPDWKAVRNLATDLFRRTKDLRVAVMLAQAVVRTDGLAEFSDALAVVLGLVERYWPDVYPRLDPEDDNDPAFRVNTLSALSNADACLSAVNEATLIRLPGLGDLTFRRYLVATGELPPRSDETPLDKAVIEAALLGGDLNQLQQQSHCLNQAVENLHALESAVTRQVGVAQATDFGPLLDNLRRMARLLQEPLERRGGAADDAQEAPLVEADSAADAPRVVAAGAGTPPPSDQVRSRQDVIRLLDKICAYYKEHEPSSPIPLLLKRAKRMATMNFIELLRDLAPSGLSEAMTIGGEMEEGD